MTHASKSFDSSDAFNDLLYCAYSKAAQAPKTVVYEPLSCAA
jgi:hypothetical protein